MKKINNNRIQSSFRDPSGFLFVHENVIYRQINEIYKENYEHLMSSGLYDALVKDGLLIPHEEINADHLKSDAAYKIIKPERIHFISYPYEWCFSQLKDAALTTLKIQKKSLDFGMTLKDSSAYNIQFRNGKPVLIDTLSFEKYKEGQPWVAYRQFCQHFLAPLTLMCHTDIRLNQLLRSYIDGIPLDLASALLPMRTRFNFSLLSNIHLHAKSQKHFADKELKKNHRKMSRMSYLGLIDNLESATTKLQWQAGGTEWAEYYDFTNYSSEAIQQKQQIIAELIDSTNPKNVWDLGANTGLFSRLASNKGIQTVAFDIDPAAVEKNYLECVKNNETKLLPLVLDLTNPSPGIGWANEERCSLAGRGPVDTVLALALIHHLAISNNLPFKKIAAYLSRLCRYLIIEFVEKEDSQVQILLRTREDIFDSYNKMDFENSFQEFFSIIKQEDIANTKRTLYLMVTHNVR